MLIVFVFDMDDIVVFGVCVVVLCLVSVVWMRGLVVF